MSRTVHRRLVYAAPAYQVEYEFKEFFVAIIPPTLGYQHVVSSGHELATFAAYEVLENGGNAVAAGVAACQR